MPRFGRARANSKDGRAASDAYQYSPGAEASGAIAGFAASAAAGGVAASMGPPPLAASASGATGAASQRSTISGAERGSSRGYGKKKGQKSITSGISTLFRRQPSPDVSDQLQMGNVNSRSVPNAPTDSSAWTDVTSKASRPAPQQAQQQYSQSQRDLSSNPGLSASRSGGISGPLSGALSIAEASQGRSAKGAASFDNTYDPSTAPSRTFSDDYSDDDESEYSDRRGQRDRAPQTSQRRKKPNKGPLRLPRRYRGFSTSIASLFLDESLVCGALACWGLLLSARTEHLLNERNVKRGLTRRGAGGEAGRGKEGGRRTPSRALSVLWIVTVLGVLATYAVWGFNEQGAGAGGYEGLYDYDEYDDAYYEQYANDDGNNQDYEEVDDGNQAEEGNDDGAQQQNDDGNANNADDGNVDADDGNNGDDANANNDDANNRQLFDLEPQRLVNEAMDGFDEEKHSFLGVMKLRDHHEHVFQPVTGFASRAYADLMDQFKDDEFHPKPARKLDEQYYDDASEYAAFGEQVRTILVVVFLFSLGVMGRRRRMRTRFGILRSRAQDDHLYYASVLTKNGTGASGSLATPDNTVMENFHEREDKYDGACSHTLFGCYPVDSTPADYADYGDDEHEDSDDDTAATGRPKRKRKGGDFMARTMNAVLACCCGALCRCWCQLFSVCALAQEAREARLLTPPAMQRIDLITHQPFGEYAHDVNNIRRRFMQQADRAWMQHWAALSNLSRYLLLGFVLITAFVTGTMLVHPMGGFDWGDALVLIATFTQSFLVLVIVFGIFHRSDLSFDAVVKFFAVGFLICVPVGFVLEAILINGLVCLLYVGYYLLHWTVGEEFDTWLIANHRIIWMVGELVNAFLVASLVEECCKYYGFRFLEHPDLLFLTGLDRTAHQTMNSGGQDSYKYDSQLVSEFSRSIESDGESLDSRGRNRRKKKLRGSYEDEEPEPELRTLQQQAAAITTGMISVAVGLACCENFLYVFFLGGTGGDMGQISGELGILLFRSVFPVHALSAAMQSINMIRKFIEEKHGGARNIGIGRIILPAVLLHGTFDAILMCVNAYIESSWDDFYENGGYDDDNWVVPYNAVAVNLIAAVGIISVMAVSFGWYSYQHKLQTLRLAAFDAKDKASGRGRFNAPNLV
ncbi:hypothetical protein ACHAXT_002129 [Thalassiosira profunda]